jgi:regulator of sirC expression with transglutaminase-like and TPR domain
VAEDETDRFAELVTLGDDLPLDEAMLAIAAHARPGLDVDAELDRLDALAGAAPAGDAVALVRHLCDDLGFAGDRETYHDARNSLLPDVLDRRLGIPISLSVVAMEVGRRQGSPLAGIGMPGHFLVRPAGADGPFLDVFDGGRELEAGACRAVFESLHPSSPWDDAFLEPVGAPAMVVRTLANLANAYRRVGDRRGLAWVLALRLLLPGVTPRDRRELAVVLGALGRFDEGAEVLEGVPEERDQLAAARLRARLN